MTNYPHTPVPATSTPNGFPVAGNPPVRPTNVWRNRVHTADAVLSTVLTVLLGCAVISAWALLFIFVQISAGPCSTDTSCQPSHHANVVLGVVTAGSAGSMGAALIGLLVSAWRRWPMIWAPTAGLLLVTLTWIVAIRMAAG